MKIFSDTYHATVAITGGICSGKSSVAVFLERRFCVNIIDADSVCRDLLQQGREGYAGFVEIFGQAYLNADGDIDRQLLRKALFHDDQLRRRINQLLHPLARNQIHDMIKRMHGSSKDSRVLVEVPLLYEAEWESDFDTVVVVYAARDEVVRRLMERDATSAEEALKVLEAQWSLTQKAVRADYTIDNSGSWPDTCLQILRLGRILWSDGVEKT